MPGLTDDLIEQFRVQQDQNSHPDQEIRKRISYKEQKLAANQLCYVPLSGKPMKIVPWN